MFCRSIEETGVLLSCRTTGIHPKDGGTGTSGAPIKAIPIAPCDRNVVLDYEVRMGMAFLT